MKINAVVPNDGCVQVPLSFINLNNDEKPSIRWATDSLPLNEKIEPLSVEDNLYTSFPSRILF